MFALLHRNKYFIGAVLTAALGIVCACLFSSTPFAFAQTADGAPNTPNVGSPPRDLNTKDAAQNDQLARDGIFGCSASKYANIGSLSAIGGVYVPVNDAAVTLNTGYLVYKECVLDGIVSQIKNDQIASLTSTAIRASKTSRNGNAQYVTNYRSDLQPRRAAIVVTDLGTDALAPMCDAFKRQVQSVIARGYLQTENSRNKIYTCPYPSNASNQAAFEKNQNFNYGSWFAAINPSGNIFGAAGLTYSGIQSDTAEDDKNIREMIMAGNGFFPALDTNQNPLAQRVLTPSFIIAQSLQRMINAGTDILVNANEIDQINGALQAGLQTTLVADTIRGLSGLSQPQNGKASYLDRMAAEASASVRANAVNAAIGILAAARQVETLYKQAKEGIAKALTDAITKLRAAETTCWDNIVPKVKEKATNAGVSLKIATTTEFSQQVIDTNIGALSAATIKDLRTSEDSLALINQLIASVANSSNTTNQRAALERLDSMVANNQLHSTQEANNAQKQKDEVVGAIGTLIEQTLRDWGDSTDPNVGWCNYNNPDVITMWFNKWKQ